MNRNLKMAAAAIFMGSAVLLAGCSQNTGPGGKHSSAWYATHTAARHKVLNWCNHRPTKDTLSARWSKSPAGVSCCEARNATKTTRYDLKHGYLTAAQVSCQGA